MRGRAASARSSATATERGGRSRRGKRLAPIAWMAVLLLAPAAVAVAQPPDPTSELLAAQARLVERTREYRQSLETLKAFEEEEARRLAAGAERRRDLAQRGLIARRDAEVAEAAAAEARAKVEQTARRIAEADALVSETLAAMEVAKATAVARNDRVVTPEVVRSRGTGSLGDRHVAALEALFASRFHRPLPISALGQTAVHDRFGLDHRHAMDVAVHPDTPEGAALIEYLERERIPFLAFRGAVPGASTGAHVHVGEVSRRLLPVRTISR